MSDLRKEHPDFAEMKSRWEMCEHAAEGEHAVHKEGIKYLPRLRDEDDDSYALRLRMTPFFNATWRTISGMRGMLFRKPPIVQMSERLKALCADIDLAGTTMEGLAFEVVEEGLTFGRVGLLVDYPVAPAGATLADSAVLRPFISLYETASIFNWREVVVNGVRKLTQVRLVEKVELESSTDEFSTVCEERIRVLDLSDGKYRQRLFKVEKDGTEAQIGADIFPQMNRKPMDFIPFVVIGVDHLGMDIDAPPLIDLVTTNFHHYRQATSYERGCFFSGLPILFVYGQTDNDGDISIGGSVANALGNPNAKAEYVEVSGKFEALRNNLEDKKREMAVLGARMLEGGKNAGGVEAAETVARRQSGEESVLASMATTVSQGLTLVLGWLSMWAGDNTAVSYKLNKDFLPQTMTAQDLTSLVSAWQAGAISQETLFENLKAGEIIADTLSFEDEQTRIGTSGPTLTGEPPAVDPVAEVLGAVVESLDVLAQQVSAMASGSAKAG